jgi:hypothetical protein
MSQGPNLFTGPAGSCPDCGEATLVRLGSFVSKPSQAAWVAQADLVSSIYSQIKALAKPGGGYIRIKVEGKTQKKYKIGKIVRCARTKNCKKKDSAAKYIWVAVNGKVGELPQQLAGPFCGVCWPLFKDEFSHGDGMDFDFPVYYVITSFEALQPIFATEDQVLETTTTDTGLDETEGLF